MSMQNSMLNDLFTKDMMQGREKEEDFGWKVTGYYDEEEESATILECMALFELENEQGWDADFKPIRR